MRLALPPKSISPGKTDRFLVKCACRHKLGHWVWVMDNGRITERDAQDTPIKMIGARLDITSRKKSKPTVMKVSVLGADSHLNTGAWEWDQSTQSLWVQP